MGELSRRTLGRNIPDECGNCDNEEKHNYDGRGIFNCQYVCRHGHLVRAPVIDGLPRAIESKKTAKNDLFACMAS